MLKRANAWLDRQNSFVQIFVVLFIVFLIRTFVFGLYQVPTGSMETTMLVGERFFADKMTPWFKDFKRGEIIAFNEPGASYDYSQNPLVNWWQRYVWGPSNWTKRIIGLPGEQVKLTVENGKPVVYINGNKLDEPYINKYPLVSVRLNQSVRGVCTDRSCVWRAMDPSKPYDQQSFYKVHPMDVAAELPRLESGTPEYSVDVNEWNLKDDEYFVMGDNRRGSTDSRFWGPLKKHMIHGRIIYRIFSVDTDESWWILDLIKHPIAFWSKVRWDRCFSTLS